MSKHIVCDLCEKPAQGFCFALHHGPTENFDEVSVTLDICDSCVKKIIANLKKAHVKEFTERRFAGRLGNE